MITNHAGSDVHISDEQGRVKGHRITAERARYDKDGQIAQEVKMEPKPNDPKKTPRPGTIT